MAVVGAAGGVRPPPGPPRPPWGGGVRPGPSGPPWWSEFEREFADHVAALQSDLPRSVPAQRSQRRDHTPADQQHPERGGADDGRRAPAARHPGLEPRDPVPGAIGCEHIAEQGYLEKHLLYDAEPDDK